MCECRKSEKSPDGENARIGGIVSDTDSVSITCGVNDPVVSEINRHVPVVADDIAGTGSRQTGNGSSAFADPRVIVGQSDIKMCIHCHDKT